MRIDRALEVVSGIGRRVPVVPNPHPIGCTLWNVPVGALVQEAVYFAYSAGRIKIGFSTLTTRRAKALAAGSPFPISIILIVPGNEAAERSFHVRFSEDRIHHEWFRLSKRMRDFLKARLCPVGRATFKAAEAAYLAEVAGEVKP